MQIFHNPRCTKSRETLQLLQRKGIEPEIFLYLQEKITQTKLKDILNKLDMLPSDIIRRNEPLYKENFKDKEYTEAEWLKILIKNPKLIERPIVISEDKAVIGRPIENVLNLIKG